MTSHLGQITRGQLQFDLCRLHRRWLGGPLRRPWTIALTCSTRTPAVPSALASDEYGVSHVGNDMGVAVADLGNDGTLDLYVTNITDPNRNSGRARATRC